MPTEKCVICGKEIVASEVIKCSVCSAPMHKRCIDEEILTDAYGNYLCPSCAAISALEWLDLILSFYASSIRNEKRSEIVDRLRNYIKMLEERGV